MNRKHLIAAIILLSAIASISYVFLSNAPPAIDVIAESVSVGDSIRTYRLVVPHRLSKPCPVLVAFHGVGDSPDSMAGYSGLDRLASEHGFLLIYPSATRSMWATMNFDPDVLDANVDVQFFDSTMDKIGREYEIDTHRVYLTGMSNGASFAQIVAHARSEQVAAVVACAGSRPRELHKALRPFPILMIVGSEDSAVDLMQSDLDHYRAAGHQADLVEVSGMGHEWSVQHNSKAWSFLSDCKLPQ